MTHCGLPGRPYAGSVAWAGGRLSLCRCFRRRRKIDRRHRTPAPTHLFPVASRVSPKPLPFQDRAPQIALVAFPGAVPEFSVDPSDACDKRLDSMVRRIAPVRGSIWWIFRSRYCPTQSVPSAQASPEPPPGRRDRGQHLPVFGSIFWMRSRRSETGGGRQKPFRHARRHRSSAALSARGVKRVQRVSRGKPDMLAVERNPIHSVDAGKGPVFANDRHGDLFMRRP